MFYLFLNWTGCFDLLSCVYFSSFLFSYIVSLEVYIYVSTSHSAACERRGSKIPTLLCLACVSWVWGAWELAWHVTSIGLNQKRKKKATLGKNYSLSTLGLKKAQAYPRPDMVQAGGCWQGAIYKFCPGFHRWSPYKRSWSRKYWQLDGGEDLSCGLKDKLAPSGCFWGMHESSFQENGHFEHLPSPVSDSSKSQGSNREWSYLLP